MGNVTGLEVPLPPRAAWWGGVRGGGLLIPAQFVPVARKTPTRLASLATLPTLASLAAEG